MWLLVTQNLAISQRQVLSFLIFLVFLSFILLRLFPLMLFEREVQLRELFVPAPLWAHQFFMLLAWFLPHQE